MTGKSTVSLVIVRVWFDHVSVVVFRKNKRGVAEQPHRYDQVEGSGIYRLLKRGRQMQDILASRWTEGEVQR